MGDHEGFCIRSIKHSKSSAPNIIDIAPTENFSISEELEKVYPLLNIVFSYLNSDDLMTASQVKPSWKIIAKQEEDRRNKLCKASWVSCYKPKRSPNTIEHSDNLHYSNNAVFGIIFYDYRRLKLSRYVCLHAPEMTRMTFAEYFAREIVPQNVKNYCLLSCPRVVSRFGTNVPSVNGSLFDGIFLPKIPGIRISMFHCHPASAPIIKKYTRINDRTKCILLFTIGTIYRRLDPIINMLINNDRFEEVAMCGGIIKGTKMFQQIPQKKAPVFSKDEAFCIVFSEPQNAKSNFNAVSHVIGGDDLTDEEFETELTKLKKRVIMRTNSIALRVCCAAKWATKESESALFNKVFPKTPLLGLEADGEIGWNSYNKLEENLDDVVEATAKKSKPSIPELKHEWSTVLLIMTWGDLLNND